MTSSYTPRLGTAPEEGIKAPVVVSTISNITLSGEQTINSVAVTAGQRVLVRSQTNTAENGIYVVATGAWSRANDMNAGNDVINGQLIVDGNDATLYQVVLSGTWTPDSTAITFNAFTSTVIVKEAILGSEAVGQVLTLTTMTYKLGVNNLLVFQNGDIRFAGVDYTETSTNSITVDSAITINPNDRWTFLANVATTSTSESASSITYNQGDSNAVNTNVQAKLQEGLSVLDFGADPTGVTASDAAFTNAKIAARLANKPVYVPGTSAYYRLNNKYVMDTLGDSIIGDGWQNSVILMDGTDSVIELVDVERCYVAGLYLSGLAGSSHGVHMTSSSGQNNINTFRDVYVGWVDGNGFHIECSISGRFYNCSVDGNNGYRPAGLAGIAGSLGSIKTNYRIFGINEFSGITAVNDNKFIGCNCNGGGDVRGIHAGDSSYQTEDFVWDGGLIQGLGNPNAVRINVRYGGFKNTHFEPNPPVQRTAQSGGTNTITLATAESSTDDYYNGNLVTIKAGTGVGQQRTISDYNGTIREATVSSAWTVVPDNTSEYVVHDWTIEFQGAKNAVVDNCFISGDIATRYNSENIKIKDSPFGGLQIDAGSKGVRVDLCQYGIRSDGPAGGVINDYSNKGMVTHCNMSAETGAVGDNTSGPRGVLFKSNMEHFVSATNIPCGFLTGGSPTVTKETTIVRSGTNSVEVVAGSTSDYLRVFLPSANQLSEQWVTVEAWIYNTTTEKLVTAEAYINSGATVFSQGATISANEWERVIFTFYPPASTSSIDIRFTVSGSGTYYIDEFIAWTGEGGFEYIEELTLDTVATPELMLTNQAYWPNTYICPTGTNITTFLTPMVGKEFTIYFTGARTLVHGATLSLNGSSNFVAASGDSMKLVYKADGVFHEVSRKVV